MIVHDRLKAGVHRLRADVDGRATSVVVKRSDPALARRSALVARRWLPAAGLADLAPRLVGVMAARATDTTWQVYEDVPGHALATADPRPDEVEAAVTAIARVHTTFADHPLLPECRAAGGGRGLDYWSDNLRDAVLALDAPVVERLGAELAPARAALLERIARLRAAEGERVTAFAAAGPDTLLHGDLWPTNMVVARDPLRVRLLDWDEAAVGPASFDLSTLLLRFEPPDRRAVLDAYARAVARAGWELPPEPALGRLLATAGEARLASLLVWSVAAAAASEDPAWLAERLESLVDWLDAVTPVVP